MSNNSEIGIKAYWPLFALILVALLASASLAIGLDFGMFVWMHFFMGFFLCQFAMLKLFDISGFADGFQMYDLLAQKSRQYALAYPFIELILGLAYLSMVTPLVTYIATIVIMVFGTIGVIRSLRKGLNIKCACMGTVLNVPLSTVTLTEDLGMAAMALIMLYRT